jgi:hypothetical protein
MRFFKVLGNALIIIFLYEILILAAALIMSPKECLSVLGAMIPTFMLLCFSVLMEASLKVEAAKLRN